MKTETMISRTPERSVEAAHTEVEKIIVVQDAHFGAFGRFSPLDGLDLLHRSDRDGPLPDLVIEPAIDHRPLWCAHRQCGWTLGSPRRLGDQDHGS